MSNCSTCEAEKGDKLSTSNNLAWHLHRLSAMTPAEVGYRLRQRMRIWQDRQQLARSTFLSLRHDIAMHSWQEFRQEERVRFFFHWAERDHWIHFFSDHVPAEKQAVLQTAHALLQHRAEFFGRAFDLGEKIPWQRDPLTGRDWPAIFYGDIDTRDGQTVGGVKWVWELNRCHPLVTLGKAYFMTGDERFAQEVCAQLGDWIQVNPPYIGVNWTSALELAVRLINWTWALAFIRQSPALTPDLFETILGSIVVQSDYISRHLSAHSSANNHLIGEVSGLAMVGLAFPWLAQAPQWRDAGLAILTRELERQIHPDGVPAEQAISYLAFVLDFNVMVWRLAELNGLAVPRTWPERLAAACDFICAAMDEEGHVPALGDSDDARVVRLGDAPDYNRYRSLLATAAVLLQRPDFKSVAGDWDEQSHWLLGSEGAQTYADLPLVHTSIGSRIFRTGGYGVMRAPGRVLVLDAGPLGYLATAAHGHADALSLTVSLDGRPVLVDAGTYAYQEGDRWRTYFRSTAAHNTLVVNRRDQSEMHGTFLWGRRANTTLLRWESTPEYDLMIACHDGYARRGINHQRAVLFIRPDWCVVVDTVNGRQECWLEQCWHLPATAQASLIPAGVQVKCQTTMFWMLPLQMPEATLQVICGAEQPIQGWLSERYGHRAPAPVVSYAGQVQLPVTWALALYFASLPSDLNLQRVVLLDYLKRLGVIE